MRRPIFLLLALLLLGLIPAAATRAQTSPTLFLTAQGKDLIYAGQKVILKGTNFDNINALGAGIGSNNVNDVTYGDADYAELARQGANHARFGLSFSWYKQNKAMFFAMTDAQVAHATRHGIFLVWNMFTTPGDCYEGYGNSCGFWGSAPEQNQLQAFWVEMATHYRDKPAVAGYDLLNEPTPPSDCKQWFPIAGRIRNAVSAVAPNQLVFVETCSDPGNDLKYNNPPKGANIVYEVHDYSPMDMSHDMFSPGSVYPGTASEWFGSCYVDKAVFATGQGCPELDIRENYGLNWASQQNVPIYIGEWGASSVLNGYAKYHQDKAELYRDWGVNHAHYTWKHQTIKTGGFYQWGMYSTNPSQTDDPAKLAAVKIAWAGAYRPTFGEPPPQPPAELTATVPPSATPLPATAATTATIAPPTAIATRTPNRTAQARQTATAAARTATALPSTATALPAATAVPVQPTATAATVSADTLSFSVANGKITIVGDTEGLISVTTWPAIPVDQSLPSFCARQLGNVVCWSGLPGSLQLPAPAGVRWVVVAQGGALRTWTAP